MNGQSSSPVLDGRDAAAVLRDLLARLPGYVPGWQPSKSGPSSALTQVFARYLQALIERLDQAPAKNELAFLDMLGINLLSAQAARAPVVFKAQPGAGNGRVPARSQVGAKVEGRSTPLVFETDSDIALAAGRLAEVVTLWPGKDAYADHSAASAGGEPFTLFQPLRPVPHELYLAHDVHFALSGQATVDLQFELSGPGTKQLDIRWEYWDGKVWRGFKDFADPESAGESDSIDGTVGLTRSGIVHLAADCAKTERTAVAGIQSYWIRGRLAKPIPPEAGFDLPVVDRILIQTVVASPLGALVLEGPEQFSIPGLILSLWPLVTEGLDVTQGMVQLWSGDKLVSEQQTVSGFVYWPGLATGEYRLRLTVPGFVSLDEPVTVPAAGSIYAVNPEIVALAPDAAFADAQKLDLTKTFFPYGQQPLPGTAFAFSNADAFGKPGAVVNLFSVKAASGRTRPSGTNDTVADLAHTLKAEYWNGGEWVDLKIGSSTLDSFLGGTGLSFVVPNDIAPTDVNGTPGLWVRMRIVEGSFGVTVTTTWKDSANTSHDIITTVTLPPALASFRLGYVYRSPKDPPRACVTYSDFAWEDHTEEARWRGASFEPYARVADRTPALYLGFDRPLPADLVSLYVDVQEVVGDTRGPDLRWEYWDGTAWSAVAVQDATAGLALPGMVSVLWPGTDPPPTATFRQASGTTVQAADPLDAARFRPHDLVQLGQDDGSPPELARVASVSGGSLSLAAPLTKAYPRGTVALAAFPRFGTPRTWLRTRLQVDGEPRSSRVNGIFTNAVWASQIQTFQGEPLGSSNGQANQTLSFRYSPVLAGQVVEVRELDGQRAEVELPILREELAQQGFAPADIRTVEDPRTGRTSEVWVRWRERLNLFFSGPADRDYVLERSRGRLRFGDDVHGRIPPAGTDNVRAAEYRSGGGVVGNVPAGAIAQLLSGVLAQSVTNARAAEGGADGEPSSRVAGRGSKVVRHRMQAMSFEDYEALAREASPAVAVARALPLTRPNGLPATGWVKVIIMPQSAEPMPEPSFELRREVLEYLQARLPASMAGQVSVAAPDYLPIGVEAQVAPVDPSQGGPVAAAATGALQAFFHPLTGGPEGEGWPFGRDVFLSDVARVLESVPGVDYVPTLELLLEGTPRGEVVEVPPDRIVVAGALRVHPTEEEG